MVKIVLSMLLAHLVRLVRRHRALWRLWLRWGMPLPAVAGGAETTTTLAAMLKEHYPAGDVVNQVNVDTFLLDKLEKAKRFTNVGGKYFYKPARFALSGAAGPRGENVALPTPGSVTYDDIQIANRYHYGTVQLTGPTLAQSRGDKNAFTEALALTMDAMYEEFRLVAAIMAYGWGSGVIGVVSSVSGNNITLADDINPATWFYEGLKIDSYQSNESTLRQAGMQVTAVDLKARVITVDTIGSTASTDRLYLASGRNVAPHGLLAGVDDSTYVDTYMGIQRTATGRAKWKAYVNGSGTNEAATKYGSTTRRSITTDLIQQVLDQQRVRAGAARAVDQIISSLGVRRAYFNSLSPDRRYNSTRFDGGWEQLAFTNGDRTIMWFADELMARYTAFFLHTGTKPVPTGSKVQKIQDEENFAIYQSIDPEWDEATGSQLKQVYSSGDFVDAVGAFLKWYYNIATCRPQIHARLDDVLES
jgi:hypothetical protein